MTKTSRSTVYTYRPRKLLSKGAVVTRSGRASTRFRIGVLTQHKPQPTIAPATPKMERPDTLRRLCTTVITFFTRHEVPMVDREEDDEKLTWILTRARKGGSSKPECVYVRQQRSPGQHLDVLDAGKGKLKSLDTERICSALGRAATSIAGSYTAASNSTRTTFQSNERHRIAIT
ncbi:hypothetical protein CB0940_07950 [Cercospora beticola]|uniref:Uncharacterized protein n=1 Tax=Cercospora beticola TaxID=122368 RepID=A0A2G5HAT4_CERBT|nr:hypothetical protein CB0940_07950 [Cercospora beticola]PIA89393.1 hypothetical protein CB0940_07950 [Cercospora beticola]WPB08505.1 hypothetical protein RHO25_013171 [Cercospora beticola]